MQMRTFINKLLGNRPSSKEDAKQRLKVLLIHDQVDLTKAQMDKMKDELLEVMARYVEIDTDNVEFELNREDGQVALSSVVPVRRVIGARA